jgi:hypothetical protein
MEFLVSFFLSEKEIRMRGQESARMVTIFNNQELKRTVRMGVLGGFEHELFGTRGLSSSISVFPVFSRAFWVPVSCIPFLKKSIWLTPVWHPS